MEKIFEYIKTTEFLIAILSGIGGLLIYWMKKIIDEKYKSKNHEKGYQDALEEKKKFIKEMIEIIENFEFRKKDLGLINDENGVPIAEETIENIYAEYFVEIFERLNEDKVYLGKDTFKKLESLKGNYMDYMSSRNIINDNYSDDESIFALKKLNEELLEKTSFDFNGLLENIKYKEQEDIQKKLGL